MFFAALFAVPGEDLPLAIGYLKYFSHRGFCG